MAWRQKRIKGSEKYKYVDLHRIDDKWEKWKGAAGKNGNGKYFDTEREAALYVDKQLIEQGKEPVNILVRK